jgi:hypothetical protein
MAAAPPAGHGIDVGRRVSLAGVHHEQSRVEECFVEVHVVLDGGESVVADYADVGAAGRCSLRGGAQLADQRIEPFEHRIGLIAERSGGVLLGVEPCEIDGHESRMPGLEDLHRETGTNLVGVHGFFHPSGIASKRGG